MKRVVIALLLLISYSIQAQDIGGDFYVAVDGSNSNPGTYDKPFATWQKAIQMAEPGDVVYIRGGIYYSTEVTTIDPDAYGGPKGASGTAENPISFFGYPGEWPILDCSLHCETIPDNPYGGTYNSALSIKGVEHWHFKDFEIRNVFQCDSVIDGAVSAEDCCNLTFEHIIMHDIGQRGYWVQGGVWNEWDGPNPDVPIGPSKWGFNHPDTTKWINCDVYNLCDSLVSNIGNAADGWKTIHYSGNYVYFEGCRAWNYSDDGFDPTGLGGIRHFKNCWAMAGDKYKYTDNGDVERNGFKVSGPHIDRVYMPDGNHLIWENCLAYNCKHGFYELDGGGYLRNNALVHNNTAYKCGIGFSGSSTVQEGPRTSIYRNNIVWGSTSLDPGNKEPYEVNLMSEAYDESHNSWQHHQDYPHFKYSEKEEHQVSDADFISVDPDIIYAQFTAPRKSDGSLPDFTALALAEGSLLIDAGVDIGLPYVGSAPDLGAFEYSSGTAPEPIRIIEYSPNPTTDIVNITYYSSQNTKINIHVYNQQDELILTSDHDAVIGDNNLVPVNLEPFASGVYSIKLNDGTSTASCSVTKEDPARELEIISITPNPTQGASQIKYYSPEQQEISVSTYNSLGVEVLTHNHSAIEGENNETTVELTGLVVGIYTISITDETTTSSAKLTLQSNTNPPGDDRLEIISYTDETYDIFNIKFTCPEQGNVTIEFFNELGNSVKKQIEGCYKGDNEVNIDISELERGEYRVTLYDGVTSVSCYVTKKEEDEEIVFEIISSEPKVTIDLFAIAFNYPESRTMTITVIDETGVIKLIDNYYCNKGRNKAVINLSELEAGDYTIILSDGVKNIERTVTVQSYYQ